MAVALPAIAAAARAVGRPSATQGFARSRSDALSEAHPRRHRRSDAVDARGRGRRRHGADAGGAHRAAGSYGRAISTFPSLTPVCLSSIATGAHGDVHEIPHLVWWHRREERVVEYGSSFGAARAAGLSRTLRDTLVGLNCGASRQARGDGLRGARRRGADAPRRSTSPPIAAGRPTGRRCRSARHRARARAVLLLQPVRVATRTGAPLSWRNRSGGHDRRVRDRGRRAGSSPVTGSTSSSSTSPTTTTRPTRQGPMRAHRRARAVRRRDRRARRRRGRARGVSRALRGHRRSPTTARRASTRWRASRSASRTSRRRRSSLRRTGRRRIYRVDGTAPTARQLALRLDGRPVGRRRACSSRKGRRVARRDGEELRFAPTARRPLAATPPSSTTRMGRRGPGPRSHCPNAGEVLVSRGRRVGVRRPRRQAPSRRRLTRLARSPATPRCRCSRSGSTRPPASIVDVAPTRARPFRRARAPAYGAVERAA